MHRLAHIGVGIEEPMAALIKRAAFRASRDFTRIQAGLVGIMSVDFRQVYAALLDDWLEVASADVLGGAFERIPLFGSA